MHHYTRNNFAQLCGSLTATLLTAPFVLAAKAVQAAAAAKNNAAKKGGKQCQTTKANN